MVDDEGRLTEPGALVDAAGGVGREFVRPLLEIKTTPCASTTELRDELFDRIERVLDRADDLDMGLVPLATPIADETIRDRPCDRTDVQDRVLGVDFEYVRHCAGTHIHVEQEPGREIDQLNPLTALDPALALVNSSSYFRGQRMGDGARIGDHPARITDDAVVVPEFDTVLEHVDAAVREGVVADSVRSYLDRMGFDVEAFDPLSRRLDAVEPVDRDRARHLRLEYAGRLARDVRHARSVNAD